MFGKTLLFDSRLTFKKTTVGFFFLSFFSFPSTPAKRRVQLLQWVSVFCVWRYCVYCFRMQYFCVCLKRSEYILNKPFGTPLQGICLKTSSFDFFHLLCFYNIYFKKKKFCFGEFTSSLGEKDILQPCLDKKKM